MDRKGIMKKLSGQRHEKHDVRKFLAFGNLKQNEQTQ